MRDGCDDDRRLNADILSELVLERKRLATSEAARTGLVGVIEELKTDRDRLRALVQILLDNDPAEPIADNGMTVLDGWRERARHALTVGELK